MGGAPVTTQTACQEDISPIHTQSLCSLFSLRYNHNHASPSPPILCARCRYVLTEREQFGQSIGDFQGMQHQYAQVDFKSNSLVVRKPFCARSLVGRPFRPPQGAMGGTQPGKFMNSARPSHKEPYASHRDDQDRARIRDVVMHSKRRAAPPPPQPRRPLNANL